ncbi:hypothetical protein [Nitrosomonas sp.]|uniref:hypothetical protein n=1 Tax=Nitrosomonas sp. TaxID=42353 RepID=UPI00262E3E70|nr:hypothetical protein [Nitrosomonas sp.]
MLCPKCGTENTDQAESCIQCHESLLHQPLVNADTNQQKSETQASDTLTVRAKESAHASDKEKPVVSMGVNIAIIIGTIIFPVVGVAMGYTYLKKDHPDARKAGRNWLVLGLIVFLVEILLINLMKK